MAGCTRCVDDPARPDQTSVTWIASERKQPSVGHCEKEEVRWLCYSVSWASKCAHSLPRVTSAPPSPRPRTSGPSHTLPPPTHALAPSLSTFTPSTHQSFHPPPTNLRQKSFEKEEDGRRKKRQTRRATLRYHARARHNSTHNSTVPCRWASVDCTHAQSPDCTAFQNPKRKRLALSHIRHSTLSTGGLGGDDARGVDIGKLQKPEGIRCNTTRPTLPTHTPTPSTHTAFPLPHFVSFISFSTQPAL